MWRVRLRWPTVLSLLARLLRRGPAPTEAPGPTKWLSCLKGVLWGHDQRLRQRRGVAEGPALAGAHATARPAAERGCRRCAPRPNCLRVEPHSGFGAMKPSTVGKWAWDTALWRAVAAQVHRRLSARAAWRERLPFQKPLRRGGNGSKRWHFSGMQRASGLKRPPC